MYEMELSEDWDESETIGGIQPNLSYFNILKKFTYMCLFQLESSTFNEKMPL